MTKAEAPSECSDNVGEMEELADNSKQSWSVVVMCYNEKETLAMVVEAVSAVMERIASQWEVIIVDDGSTDGSLEVAHTLEHKYAGRVRCVPGGINRGIGWVLRTGWACAQMENVVAVPADGQFDVWELIKCPLVEKRQVISFYRNEFSYAIYNNRLKAFYRDMLSWMNNHLINRWLLGLKIRDVNWVKVFKRETLRRIPIRTESPLVTSEVCAKLALLGYEFVELPSRYLARRAGTDHGASVRQVVQSVRDLVVLVKEVWRFKRHWQANAIMELL